MENNKALSLIGLATKAGKNPSAENFSHREIREDRQRIPGHCSRDSSENTKKKFRNMCTYYEVPLYILSDKEALGHAMGKEFRASLAVQDANFAQAIMKVLGKEGREC